jgi:pimeloyl-ACP methyl ester carboxylesterase
MPTIQLHAIECPKPADTIADVVFIHGLGGDHLTTWHPQKQPDAYWPLWLSQDIPSLRVWSLSYPADATRWNVDSSAMGLLERSKNVLEFLSVSGIGGRPVIFITHSLGGVLVKQLLHTAETSNIAKWAPLVKHTRGIVFLATPHVGSSLSQLASALSFLTRPSKITKDLEHGSDYLQQLSHWFSQNAGRLNIKVDAYHETLGFGDTLVVDRISANPSVLGCIPVGIDGNHFTICKPGNKNELVYRGVCKFIQSTVSALHQPSKPVRIYFVPGYTDSFRRLQEAISSQQGWHDCKFVHQDARRLQHHIERAMVDDSLCHVLFIDLVESHRGRKETEHAIEVIRVARSLGHGLSFKPIFVFFSKKKDLQQTLLHMEQDLRQITPSNRAALERYFHLEPARSDHEMSERVQAILSRIRTEWSTSPKSSTGAL